MDFKLIQLKVEDGIAQIIINRPKVLNALSFDTGEEILEAAKILKNETNIHALIISGNGGNFAAGADIAGMLEAKPNDVRKLVFNRIFNYIEALEFPVIAAISGYALGGGLELALACDIRICSADAKLGLPEITLGIFPGAGGTQRLPKIIGAGRAKEMIFTGRPIDSKKALEIGLVNAVAEGDVMDDAFKMAKIFRNLSPVALGAVKRVVNFGLGNDLQTGIRFEEEVWSGCFATEDQREGMKAFAEKRKPVFKGK